MLNRLLSAIFGCSHRRTSFPQTPKGAKATYVSCLDCGREFGYDWSAMRITGDLPKPAPLPVVVERPKRKAKVTKIRRAG